LFVLIGFLNFVFRHIAIVADSYLEIYLETHVDGSNLPKGWTKTADFNLALINQVNDQMTIRKGIFSYFGFLKF